MWACEFNFAYSLFIFEITIHKCIWKWLMSFFFIKSYCPHVFMLFIISWISVNMFDIVTKYDLRQPCKSRSPRQWNHLTHWGRVTHICASNLTIIGSDNGLLPGRYQAIIWTNVGILLIGPWWTNFGEILIDIQTFSFKKMRLEVLSGKWRPFCLSLIVC